MIPLQIAREALEAAEQQFLLYRDAHMAKAPTPDTIEKAKVNSQMANRMGEALAAIDDTEPDTTQPTDVEAVFLRMAELQDGNAQPSTIDLINDLATLIRQQQAEIEALKHDIESYISAANDYATKMCAAETEIERLRGTAHSIDEFARERERKEIVVWLRAQNNDFYPPIDDTTRGAWNAYSGAATAIERKDHRAALSQESGRG